MALQKKAGSSLEEKGHGEGHGGMGPDEVDLVRGGEEVRVDRFEVEHGTGGQEGSASRKGSRLLTSRSSVARVFPAVGSRLSVSQTA